MLAMLLMNCLRNTAVAFRVTYPLLSSSQRFHGAVSAPLRPTLRALSLLTSGCSSLPELTNVSAYPPSSEVQINQGCKKLKVRQHVNPLAASFQQPIELESGWVSSAYANPHANQFVVDVGSAKGSWAIEMCKNDSSLNVLGIEIRNALVENCLLRKAKWNLKNVHFLSCNANVNLQRILSDLKSSGVTVSTVTIQFPDPQYKERHRKRRLVNAEFVRNLAGPLPPGAKVFMQSDVEDLIEDMVSHFAASPLFTACPAYDPRNLESNSSPFPVQTEREVATLGHGLPVYRMMFVRNEAPFASEVSPVLST